MPDTARRARKFPWLLVAALVLIAAGAAGYAVYGLPGVSLATSPVGRWKAAAPDDRKEAAQKLIASQVLLGKSRDEVLRDLGPPDRTDEAVGSCEWKVALETKMGRDERDRPALQDETTYLTVRFVDGAAAFANMTAYITEHK